MGLELHADPATVNCHKVIAALDHMGTDYKLFHTDYVKGEHKSPDYLRINPNATLPSATHDGIAITQSNAIMQYAAESGGRTDVYPTDPRQRAIVNSWLLWESSDWFRSSYVFLVENVMKGLYSLKPDAAVLAEEEKTWLKLANVLNDQLAKTKYVAGDTVTLADFAIMAPLHLHQIQKLPLDKVPNVQRYIADMEKVPAWRDSQAYVDKVFGLDRYVQATLNYTKDSGSKPTEVYFYEDERAEHAHAPGDDPREVRIHDGWGMKDQFSADKHGFSVHSFNSVYPRDKWNDDDCVKEKFYPEVAEFVRSTVGASRVLVFDHTIRTRSNDAKKLTDESKTSQRGPVRLVHCDYTAESGPLRMSQLMGDEAEALSTRRMAFLNVWKPLSKVEEMPLAMCDITSSPKEDFVKLYLRYRDRTGENYVMHYSSEHKWFYFPGIDETQCIMLKTYDSDESRARFVGHSAFEDPTTKPDAPYRESVEIRTIAFF